MVSWIGESEWRAGQEISKRRAEDDKTNYRVDRSSLGLENTYLLKEPLF